MFFRNRSLIWPALALLAIAVGATVVVGYAINAAILRDVVEERLTWESDLLSERIQIALDKRIDRLSRFRETWLADTDWLFTDLGLGEQSVTPESGFTTPDLPQEASAFEPVSTMLGSRLKEMFPLWKLDLLLILDAAGRVKIHLPESLGASITDIAETVMRDGPLKIGEEKDSVSLVRIGGKGYLLFRARMDVNRRSTEMVVLGYRLDSVVSAIVAKRPQLPFALYGVKGALGGDLSDKDIPIPSEASLKRAIVDGVSTLMIERGHDWGLYIAPLLLKDRRMAVVMPVDLSASQRVLDNSRGGLLASGLLLIGILVALGLAMDRLILRPLRRLREKAALMVEVCSGNEQSLRLDKTVHSGNEISMLERAYEAASVKLYSHVSQLTDINRLLEGMALKDP
ncbi:MAG: hypothetical protein HQL50_06185, partial [Magnetococcales bacterium]|nr:hypothetical protein [Magnetococcales bacterium]